MAAQQLRDRPWVTNILLAAGCLTAGYLLYSWAKTPARKPRLEAPTPIPAITINELETLPGADAGAPKKRLNDRRVSVAGESYDPTSKKEERVRVVHPKSEEEALRIRGFLKNLLLFRSLDAGLLNDVVNAVQARKVAAGEKLIEQGTEGHEFYVVDSGHFEVIKDGESKTKYKAGNGFGELALLYNQARAASVVALEPSVVWALDRATFRATVVLATYNRRQRYNDFLRQVQLFRDVLNDNELSRLADVLGREEYEPGQAIVKEGEQGDLFFIVEDGEVIVSKREPDGGDKEFDRLRSGQYFGEVALLKDGVRAATVTAASKVSCLVIDQPSFLRLLGPCLDPLQRKMSTYSD